MHELNKIDAPHSSAITMMPVLGCEWRIVPIEVYQCLLLTLNRYARKLSQCHPHR